MNKLVIKRGDIFYADLRPVVGSEQVFRIWAERSVWRANIRTILEGCQVHTGQEPEEDKGAAAHLREQGVLRPARDG